jgi:hypothetical protein
VKVNVSLYNDDIRIEVNGALDQIERERRMKAREGKFVTHVEEPEIEFLQGGMGGTECIEVGEAQWGLKMTMVLNNGNKGVLEERPMGAAWENELRVVLGLRVDESAEEEVAGDGFCGYVSLERCVRKGDPFSILDPGGRDRLVSFVRWLVSRWVDVDSGCGERVSTGKGVLGVLENGGHSLSRSLWLKGAWVSDLAREYGFSLWVSMDGEWMQRVQGVSMGLADNVSNWVKEAGRDMLCCANSHFHVMGFKESQAIRVLYDRLVGTILGSNAGAGDGDGGRDRRKRRAESDTGKEEVVLGGGLRAQGEPKVTLNGNGGGELMRKYQDNVPGKGWCGLIAMLMVEMGVKLLLTWMKRRVERQ